MELVAMIYDSATLTDKLVLAFLAGAHIRVTMSNQGRVAKGICAYERKTKEMVSPTVCSIC